MHTFCGACNSRLMAEIRKTEHFAPKRVFVTVIMVRDLDDLVLTATPRASHILVD